MLKESAIVAVLDFNLLQAPDKHDAAIRFAVRRVCRRRQRVAGRRAPGRPLWVVHAGLPSRMRQLQPYVRPLRRPHQPKRQPRPLLRGSTATNAGTFGRIRLPRARWTTSPRCCEHVLAYRTAGMARPELTDPTPRPLCCVCRVAA